MDQWELTISYESGANVEFNQNSLKVVVICYLIYNIYSQYT